jgi:hypothetical protein
LPGWQTSTADIRDYEKLPHNAKKYIEMIEEQIQVPGMYVCKPVCFLAGPKPSFSHFDSFNHMQSMNQLFMYLI